MPRLGRFVRSVYDTWAATQVELHGQYSFERLRSYCSFVKSTSYARVLALCLLAPFPCLILITLIDSVPLEHPDKGTNANYVHWLRNFVTIFLISYAMLAQFPLSVPGLPLGLSRLIFTSFFASVGGVGFQFLMSHVIGFPLPFSLIIGTPMWFLFICINFAYYFGVLLRDNVQFRVDLGNYFVVFIAQVSLTLIYPAYIYGFQSIDSASQNVYVILLPIIKILLKNWMSKFLGKMDDMKPEIVIFNVEIFNALYVACCMQSTTSISTTLIISFVDWFQAWLSIRDVNVMLDEIKFLLGKIPAGHPWEKKNFLEIALIIIDEDERVNAHQSRGQTCVAHSEDLASQTKSGSKQTPSTWGGRKSKIVVPVASSHDTEKAKPITHDLKPVQTSSSSSTMATIAAASRPNDGESKQSEDAVPATTLTSCNQSVLKTGGDPFDDAQRRYFVKKTTYLMFTTEFVLLVEYTEVIVPIIYSVYVAAAYHLPNREFYSQLAKMDISELVHTVKNVFVYAGFELVSFLVMSYILKKKLQIDSFKQLAFVLYNQWMMVQSKLVLWFFYAVQNSLTHFGADFSFKFAWLHSPS